tara:strand:- start:3216 stop:3749 length:534 start_codon:yes stop_codon:yes gene_type:complete
MKSQTGYTIIELVIVIVLVGIISAVGFSRILRSDTYNAIIARDQIVSLARSAQQRAIGRSDVAMTIQPDGDDLEIRIQDGGGTLQTAVVSSISAVLSGDVNEQDGCSVTPGADTITNAAPFVLSFDELGDLLAGGVTGAAGFPEAVSTAARVCINNDPAMSVCWSASGYAYVGDCIE